MNFIGIYRIKKAAPPLNINVKVDQLTQFDMIYSYHLIYVGLEIQLTQEEIKLNGDIVYSVYYKNFKLGVVNLSGFYKLKFREVQKIQAHVSAISKEKYLPLKGLEVVINEFELKKAV